MGLLSATLLSCFATSPAAAVDPSQWYRADAPVGTFDGRVLTVEEVDPQLLSALQQLNEARHEALTGLIDDHLLNLEAKTAGVEINAFIGEAIEQRLVAPTIEDARAMFEERVGGKQAFDLQAEELVEMMRSQAAAGVLDDLVAELRKRHAVEILLPSYRIDLPDEPPGQRRGPEDAKVILAEFTDLQCPYCRRAAETMDALFAQYGDQVQHRVYDFPLSQIHAEAHGAHQAARCAGDQGKYWEMRAALFAQQGQLQLEDLQTRAEELDLNPAAFGACLATERWAQAVDDDRRLGSDLGVTGTPSFLVNGRRIVGAMPAEVFAEEIRRELDRPISVSGDPSPFDPRTVVARMADQDLLLEEIDAHPTVVSLLQRRSRSLDENTKVRLGELLVEMGPQGPAEAVGESLVNEPAESPSVAVLVEPYRMDVPLGDAPGRGGPSDAPIILVSFSDFQCPYCTRGEAVVERVLEDYGDQVHHRHRDFPLSFHHQAARAAEAARCANEQGKFWEMYKELFARQAALGDPGLKAAADAVKLKRRPFLRCLESERWSQAVQADLEIGSALGVSGTPAFFINGIAISGAQPYEAFVEIIEQELAAQAR